MPETQRIVINTSPLIALVSALGDLSVLQSLYTQVLVPFEICQERSHSLKLGSRESGKRDFHPLFFARLKASQYENEFKAIANHRLAVREMAKENEDLQRLKEVETLEPEFLQWLRTSFDNGGKSIIDAI